jgi:N-acetylneuraminic acid mutarotase
MRNGNAEMLKDFYEYDPAVDQWTKKANYGGIAIDQAIGFSIGNKGYIGLGLSADTGAGRDMSNHLWEYNPASDTWTRKKNWPFSEVSGGISFSLNNKAYVGIGWGHDHLVEYDPEKDEWTRTFEFQGVPRSGAVAFTINDKGFILAGATAGSFLADLWEFSPAKP